MVIKIAVIIFSIFAGGCVRAGRLRPFTTDGCSVFPDGTSRDKTLWLDCCTIHDRRYWLGGTKAQRLEADRALRRCVAAVGEPKVAKWMLSGARVGGTPYLPTSFRWGYGWPYLRGYKPVTEAESKLAEEAGRR